jgi:hypothetical protein
LPVVKRRKPASTFAHGIWACDFLQTHDVWFRPIFAFFTINVGTREVVHVVKIQALSIIVHAWRYPPGSSSSLRAHAWGPAARSVASTAVAA